MTYKGEKEGREGAKEGGDRRVGRETLEGMYMRVVHCNDKVLLSVHGPSAKFQKKMWSAD